MTHQDNRLNRLIQLLVLLLAIVIWPSIAHAAKDTGAAEQKLAKRVDARCQKLVPHASVTMVFDDVQTEVFTQHSMAVLKSLSDKRGPKEKVYGLTKGKPIVKYAVNRAKIKLPNGHICVVPRVKVRATFTEMSVYIANELRTNPCKQLLIRAHEMEHVQTWKSHLQGGMALLKKPLQAAFSTPREYASKKAADADLRPWVVGTIDPKMKQLFQSVLKAQEAIDSPASYRTVLQQMNACPAF